jgi:hypothetical protein
MTPAELKQLVPIPFMDLLALPDPPSKMDLDAVLPILLDRAESLAATLFAALQNDAAKVDASAFIQTADMLHEHVRAANAVFRAWNLRPGQPGIPPRPPTPPATPAPEPPDVTLPDPDTA